MKRKPKLRTLTLNDVEFSWLQSVNLVLTNLTQLHSQLCECGWYLAREITEEDGWWIMYLHQDDDPDC